jgi:hypothetical protein
MLMTVGEKESIAMNRPRIVSRDEWTPGRPPSSTAARDLEFISRIMDSLFQIPGTRWRVGIDPVLGLIPGVGDFISSFFALFIILAGVKYGVPKITLLRMGLNVGLDLLIGAIPVVGDLFDVWWKANERNVALLRRSLMVAGPTARRAQLGDWLFVGLIVAGVLIILFFAVSAVWFLLGQLVGLLGIGR